LVSRPRLLERLNAGLDRKLTFVSAPAGFGKTTLASEWVNCQRCDSGRLGTCTFRLALIICRDAMAPNKAYHRLQVQEVGAFVALDVFNAASPPRPRSGPLPPEADHKGAG
jgi:hypothetical protein